MDNTETYEPEIPFPETTKPKPFPESTPSFPLEKTDWVKFTLVLLVGIMVGAIAFGILIFSGQIDAFMTDGQCDELLLNASIYGYDTALSQVLNKTLACDGVVPIVFGNETHDIFAVECLQGVQNG